MKRALLIIVAAMWLVGCTPEQKELAATLKPPVITANPIPSTLFTDSSPTLSANITAGGSAIEIIRLQIRLNRDRDPTRFEAQTAFTATLGTRQSGDVTVTLPSAYALKRAQLLTVRWSADYRLRTGGDDVATVWSDMVSVRQGCTPTQVNNFLSALQSAATNPSNFPQRLSNVGDVAVLTSKGYVPTHFFLSFRGMGVAFAQPDALRPQELIDLAASLGQPQFTMKPHLLFYAPSPAASSAAVSEPTTPDFPYTLIGFAFASPYDPAGPPSFGCVPREAWFVHEAGWHLPNGGFTLQAISESAPGDENPSTSTPQVVFPGDARFGGIWHPRLWDIHLWINPGGPTAGPPILSQCNPAPTTTPPPDFFATTGAATCGAGAPQFPPTGAVFPSGGFFVRALPR